VGLGLIGIVACGLVKRGNEVAAIKAIERKGGFVEISQKGPRWFAGLFGDYYPFRRVFLVELGFGNSDADVKVIESLPQAKMVFLNGTTVRGPGLAVLSSLRALQFVDLTQSDITDEGLQYLDGIQTLQRLGLARTKISDAGLAHLRSCVNLRELDLEGTAVTDAGLYHLESAPLKRLDIRGTLVTSKGISWAKRNWPGLEIVQ